MDTEHHWESGRKKAVHSGRKEDVNFSNLRVSIG